MYGLNAIASTDTPSSLVQQIDYVSRTDGQPIYVGFANRGTSTSSDGWIIQFFSYITIGSSDFVSSRTSSVGIWNNRASLTYA